MLDNGAAPPLSGGRFSVRAFQPGDEGQVLELFARSFPHAPRTIEHFNWKFCRNPFGNGHISLAFEGARLVGHYAGYCVPFVGEGVEYPAHQIGDTMTEPAVRHVGRGPTSILGRTALHFYATFCEQQMAFNYGFNVANIQRFSLRFLRSDRVEPVTYRCRDVLARPFRRIKAIGRLVRGYHLELVRSPGSEFDHLFARVAPAYGLQARRDARYLRWRYFDCPDRPRYFVVAIRRFGRLVGWSAFRIVTDTLRWGDLLLDPEHVGALEVLLRHVVPSYPVRAVEGWFPPRPRWLSEAITKMHFESRPEPQDLSLMCVPFTLEDAVTRMREGLYYTWGDSDLF
jgi:Acetyltransferase (GNAT) domain